MTTNGIAAKNNGRMINDGNSGITNSGEGLPVNCARVELLLATSKPTIEMVTVKETLYVVSNVKLAVSTLAETTVS